MEVCKEVKRCSAVYLIASLLVKDKYDVDIDRPKDLLFRNRPSIDFSEPEMLAWGAFKT